MLSTIHGVWHGRFALLATEVEPEAQSTWNNPGAADH